MDRAIWITWYDLPSDSCDDYLSWLQDCYLPGLLARPGLLWASHYECVKKESRPATHREIALHRTKDASVPAGSRYILLAGARHANEFANPVPSALHAGLSSESRKMLSLRIGERVNIMAEAARVEGPDAEHYADGMALAPCIQLGTFNCSYLHEEEMLAWYAQWRMPAMRKMPGCIRVRRLASVAGWAKHGVLYEFSSLQARNQHFVAHEDQDPAMMKWSDQIVQKLVHAPGSSALACRTWPAISG
jgi:hypothetical protein